MQRGNLCHYSLTVHSVRSRVLGLPKSNTEAAVPTSSLASSTSRESLLRLLHMMLWRKMENGLLEVKWSAEQSAARDRSPRSVTVSQVQDLVEGRPRDIDLARPRREAHRKCSECHATKTPLPDDGHCLVSAAAFSMAGFRGKRPQRRRTEQEMRLAVEDWVDENRQNDVQEV